APLRSSARKGHRNCGRKGWAWKDLRARACRAAARRAKAGRRERIRTSGPHVPNVVLYQAELLSVAVRRAVIAMRIEGSKRSLNLCLDSKNRPPEGRPMDQ